MNGLAFLLLIVLLIMAVPAVARVRREARRRELRARPFPPEWESVLDRNVPLYRRLPSGLKEQLHGHINVFLAEKNFEGGDGFPVTDEIKVTVAAQACVLLLNRETGYYPRLRSIIVYAGPYEVEKPIYFSGAQHIEGTEFRLGESWPTGAIALAWDHARQSARDIQDGHNLVFHEFAHQLDAENAQSDGIPALGRASRYISWARVLGKEFLEIQRRVKQGMMTGLLDKYAATNSAEFFAVATECFFEKPAQMRQQYPALYQELKNFYNQDPVLYYAAP